jgi:GTP-binding protein Era
MKSGFVALVGRPNVGKSTLLNAILGEKVSIVTPKPQTTRTRINGILNRPGAQVVFVDTPGMVAGRSALHKAMRRLAGSVASDAEVALVLIAANTETPGVAPEDRDLVRRARRSGRRVVLALNKVDRVRPKTRLLPWIELCSRELGVETVIPISALRGDGVKEVVEVIVDLLPEGPAFFPTDLHTDAAERFLCEELIREQLLLQTQQEVPHRAAVVIESFEDGRRATEGEGDGEGEDDGGGLCRIEGRIIVERESHKAIVIGKRGARIKQVSERARIAIERLLGCKVFLRMTVHVDPRWTDDPRALRRYGLDT